jgi:hypothetical protein
MSNIYVNCGGTLLLFKNKNEVLDFFEDCILNSEGAERERYSNIYFDCKNSSVKEKTFTDSSPNIFSSNFKLKDVDDNEAKIIKEKFGISKDDLLKFEADKYLSKNADKIYQSTLYRYKDLDELYDNYLIDKSITSFYYFDSKKIICIDTSAKGSDRYWEEEFPIKDYKYAEKWLKQEIDFSDYLNKDKEEYSL